MKRSDRAKIFGAFNPLKNLGEALARKEKIIVPKAELSDDRMEEIDRVLHLLEVGKMVTLVFYNGYEYQKIEGCVSEFSPENKRLAVAKREILFENIYDLCIDE